MKFLSAYWFEVLLVVFLICWLILRSNGFWQRMITSQYNDERFVKKHFHNVFPAVKDALKYCGFSINEKEHHQDSVVIRAEAQWTMKSFGEYIRITVTAQNQGTLIDFQSRCKVETQIFDWGKNKQNAKRFFKVIDVIT